MLDRLEELEGRCFTRHPCRWFYRYAMIRMIRSQSPYCLPTLPVTGVGVLVGLENLGSGGAVFRVDLSHWIYGELIVTFLNNVICTGTHILHCISSRILRLTPTT